jgi:Cu2+-exporting ATPase
VYPGERIPVDGEVLSGEATVDQQQLTGESMPIVANPGTYVYAATLLRSGQLRLRCERVGNQTRAAASIELLAKAPVHDTRMANYAAQLADKLIVPSLVLAGVVYGATQDPTRAASILTLDFVTGIRVSMPTAFLGALNHITRHGVLVRSGRTLELLAAIDTVVFDKTGTLTQGRIAVEEVICLDDRHSPAQILQWAASAEQRITHPVAEAIAAYAQAQGIEIRPRQHWHYQVGSGMEAEIDGQMIWVGSEAFLRSQGLVPAGEILSLGRSEQSVVYVANPEGILGLITYTDPLRLESASLVNILQHQYFLEVHVLTGDNANRAQAVAQSLGIPAHQVHAEAFPEDKAKIVRDLRRSGRVVAFVGDGLNDSVALAYADVSISFADGSDIARETADVVLMNNDLTSILEAIAIAKETQALIEQNTLLVVAPNVVGLGLAATVGLNPLWATLIHNGTAILAGLNSLRPLALHPFEKNSALPN